MPDYQEIYFHNIYEIELDDGGHFTFSLKNFQDNIFFNQPFAIITACNTMNHSLSDEENAILTEKLYSELYRRYRLLSAEGCYKGHCEAGYLVFDISLSEALMIGHAFEQYAIFYNTKRELKYIECENGKVIVSRKR